MDEENFESAIPANQPTVAIDKKHAYSTVVLKPSIPVEDPSPSKGLSGKDPSVIKPERDKINNLPQKEKRLEEAGVTRRKAYQVIADALEAVIEYEVRDSDGMAIKKTRPDLEKRKWGAEMALKVFGDLIERKEIEYDISEGALARLKKLSVSELKARAADILLGKNTSRIAAIDVTPEASP